METPVQTFPESESFAHRSLWSRLTLWFLVVTTLIRLAQLPTMELAPDEAYYWDWSRHLALGYYDQGPLIAYVIRLTTAIFGTNEFGVRFGVCMASLGTLIACFVLARRIFSPLAGLLAVLLLGVTPLMEVGSLIATYDPLLVVFWAWTLVWLERALFTADPAAQKRAWLWAGVIAGFGFLSKHTMMLIAPCLIVFLTASPRHRFWLARPHPYLAFGIVLLMYSGVIWWNAHNHWWTFGHLFFLTAKTFGTPWSRLGEYIGGQALLLGPVLFFALLDVCRRFRQSPHFLFLISMGLPVIGFFCLMALKSKVQANWSPFAWLSLTVLLAGVMASGNSLSSLKRKTLVLALPSLILTILMAAPPLRLALGIRLSLLADHSNTTHGWKETAQYVQKIRKEMEREGKPVFLCANGYQYAALMGFYLPDHPEVHDLFLHFRLTMYAAHVGRLKSHLGENALYINENRVEDPYLREIFEEVEWAEPLPIWRKPYYDFPIRTIQLARCRNYRRYVGLEWAEGG
jgi:4-amino-4-deoxy-L-arabinose transferase-like glycosyltransferase